MLSRAIPKWIIIVENDDAVRRSEGKFGSDLRTDWPFTDAKWIKPLAKIRAFRTHKDRR